MVKKSLHKTEYVRVPGEGNREVSRNKPEDIDAGWVEITFIAGVEDRYRKVNVDGFWITWAL